MSINIIDLSNSPYIASDDFAIGTKLPPGEIVEIKMEEVPVPNSTKKNRKAIAYFKDMKRGWCINKTEARKIGRVLGSVKEIDKTWLGARLQLMVVGNVRRPDGTHGNAFRVHMVWPVGASEGIQVAALPVTINGGQPSGAAS